MINKKYIKEADSTINGGCNDVTEFIQPNTVIICTYGHHNVFYVNGDHNGNLLRLQDVRIISIGETVVEFECWKKGDRTNSVSVEIPLSIVETVTCGGHFSSAYPVDMSVF